MDWEHPYALELILRLDMAMDSWELSSAEFELRKLLKKKLLGLCSLERSIERKRSRLLHLKEGDANTNFFHRHAKHRQRKNMIMSLRHNDEIIIGQDRIATVEDDYYGALFGSTPAHGHALHLEALNLPSFDLQHLEESFTVKEVIKVIKSMPFDKAPGPDGFTTRFYATCWGIIKEDFMEALSFFPSWRHARFGLDQ